MQNPKRWAWIGGAASILLAGGLVFGLTYSGCVRKPPDKTPPKKEDYIELARELFRGAAEAPSFRNAGEVINKHLTTNPGSLDKLQPGTRDRDKLLQALKQRSIAGVDKLNDRALYDTFLESVVGLDKAEIEEVNSATFKLLDGRHLEGCQLLREAARAMPLGGLTPLERAAYCFRWVVRNVLLQEPRDEVLAPQFVLRRGQSSAQERAFVFLSLLRQLDLDGCVLFVPESGKANRFWLTGVLIPGKEKTDVYLFDTRLGLPLPGPKGQGVATLAQLQQNPEAVLGAFAVPTDDCKYDVEAKQIGTVELHVLMSLSALSARMRFLEEEVLFGFDRVNVACRAADLLEKFEALQAGPVRVWNPPTPAKGFSQSPTRSLREFLPAEEGGIDPEQQRIKRFNEELIPGHAILQGYADLQLSFDKLASPDVQKRFFDLAERLWMNYGDTPAQQLVRGRLDDCAKRLVYILMLLDNLRGGNINEEEKDKQIKAWRERVIAAYAQEKAAEINMIWAEDQWLMELILVPDDAIAGGKQVQRKLLSYIVLRAIYDPLFTKASFLLSLRWHEMAERLQVRRNVVAAAGPDAAAALQLLRKETKHAWDNAQGEWAKYGRAVPLTSVAITARLAPVEKLHKAKANPVLAVGLLESQLWYLREAASVRLLYAQALEESGDAGGAEKVLSELIADLAALQNHQQLKDLVQQLRTTSVKDLREEQQNHMRRQLARVSADLGPGGTFWWIRFSAAVRLAQLRGKG